MAQCTNCKKSLSCGCQRKKASDGTMVCAHCITAYEAAIKKIATVDKSQQTNK